MNTNAADFLTRMKAGTLHNDSSAMVKGLTLPSSSITRTVMVLGYVISLLLYAKPDFIIEYDKRDMYKVRISKLYFIISAIVMFFFILYFEQGVLQPIAKISDISKIKF